MVEVEAPADVEVLDAAPAVELADVDAAPAPADHLAVELADVDVDAAPADHQAVELADVDVDELLSVARLAQRGLDIRLADEEAVLAETHQAAVAAMHRHSKQVRLVERLQTKRMAVDRVVAELEAVADGQREVA